MDFSIKKDVLEKYNGNDERVVIPDSVKRIGRWAFRYCKSIKEITIPDSVTGIDYGAFDTCINLQSVSIPDSVDHIGESAFSICRSLKEVKISNTIRYISRDAFSLCESLEAIIIPRSVKRIGNGAFSWCKKLKSIEIPDSVIEIGESAFYGCASLKSVRIPDSVTEIGESVFSECTSLESVFIPASVKKIGKFAFQKCISLNNVTFEEPIDNIGESAFQDCTALADSAGCIVVNGCLFGFAKNTQYPKISDGVRIIKKGALRRAPFVNPISLPDSLEVIESDNTEAVPRPISSIPKKMLYNGKNDGEFILKLMNYSWKQTLTIRDYAAILLFQTSKKLLKYVDNLMADPNSVINEMCAILRENNTGKKKDQVFKRAVDYFFEHEDKISREAVTSLYEAAASAGAKKAVDSLKPFAANISAPAQAPQNPVEEFCYQNYDPQEFEKYLKRNKLPDSVFGKVKYKDSNEVASKFVVECAVIPYMMQLVEIPYHGLYKEKTNIVLFKIDPMADKVAESLDKESLIDSLGQSLYIELLAPYCRYASGKQIKELQGLFKEWANWNECGKWGRSNIIVARGAMLLNDSREALLIAEKDGNLQDAACIRNVSVDYLRDVVLSDFSFDPDGKKRYDLGGTVIEASLNDDLTISLYDTVAKKTVKSLPKRGSDEKKLEEANRDYSDLKKNVKSVVKSRVKKLKEDFTSGKTILAKDWKQIYIKNPVLRKIGELIVWQVKAPEGKNGATFMLLPDGSFIGYDGQPFEVPEDSAIAVAHPFELAAGELSAWRQYLRNASVAQPFTQMFEPVYTCIPESLSDRYRNVELPYYRLMGLEKEGFSIDSSFREGNISGHSASLEFMCIDTPDPKYVHYEGDHDFILPSDIVRLLDFKVYSNRINKEINHALYLLDGLSFETAVRSNNIEMVSGLAERLTEKNILGFIKAAEDAESSDCLLWLINYKNEHFPDAVDDLSI